MDTKVSDLTDGVTLNATDWLYALRSPYGSGDDVKIAPAYVGTFLGLSVASSKILTVSNTLTFTGTDSTSHSFPSTNATVARSDAAQTFAGLQTFSSGITGNANVLDVINSTTAQALHVFNNFTDASNYERGVVDWVAAANVFSIGTQNAGSGTARNVVIVHGGTTKVTISASSVTLANGLVAGSDISTSSTGGFYWSLRSAMFSPSDGLIRLSNQAGSDFGRLQFGGTTSSFPALKRSGALLQARLGDDTAFTEFECSNIITNNAAAAFSTNTTLADGAGAQVGTLANAPTAGNPTKWISFDDNGTTRYLPSWT